MKIGDRVKIVVSGKEGAVVEKVSHIGLPLIVRCDDGGRFHCGHRDVVKIA